jgi:hypothetical protein
MHERFLEKFFQNDGTCLLIMTSCCDSNFLSQLIRYLIPVHFPLFIIGVKETRLLEIRQLITWCRIVSRMQMVGIFFRYGIAIDPSHGNQSLICFCIFGLVDATLE